MHEISRIIFPTSDFIEHTNLFFNEMKTECVFKNKLQEVNFYKFNTWMNMFPVKNYFKYCFLDELYFNIKMDTDAEILFYGLNYNEAYENSDELILKDEIKANEEKCIKLDEASKYENIYFCLAVPSNNFNIEKAFFGTNNEPLRNSKIAVVTCTFKREKFVLKNANRFNDFISKNQELSQKLKLFIVDNGRTLDRNIENDNVKLFPNKNAGGAGGFTRGIMEVRKLNQGFTRILLMDDDVEIFPESFLRTLILADYLKPEYKKAFINGAMLDLYSKNNFFESIALKTSEWVKSYHGKLDISKPMNVAKTNHVPDEIFKNPNVPVSSAWWYCCFSLETVEEKGLPLPVFIRADDLEWSWRNYSEYHISINGICVWHSPFEWRTSKPVDYYFSRRNVIMANFIHTDNFKPVLLKFLKRDITNLLRTYDYSSCEIYLRMMKDILDVDLSFRKEPEELLKEIFEYIKNDKIFESTDRKICAKLKAKYLEQKKGKTLLYRIRHEIDKMIIKISLHGKLIPMCLWRKNSNVWLESNQEDFFIAKTVNVWNFLTNKYEKRNADFQKEKLLQERFDELYEQIENKYDEIRAKFINSYKEFTTNEFWEKYLEVEKY